VDIVIITQDEPFYLSENIDYLISVLPQHSKITGCVVSDVSPFGKKESFFRKALKTYKIFGLRFFAYYSFKFVLSKVDVASRIDHVLHKNGIEKIVLTQSINHPDSVKIIKRYQPDLLVSILGNQIFKEPIINMAPKGCLNLHTALLPKYRGLMPTFWVLKNEESVTGVSVFFVDEGIDSGPIIVQKEVDIGNKTQEELIRVTKKLGMNAISEAIDLIDKGNLDLIENDEKLKTYYSFPNRGDVKGFLSKGKKFF